MLFIRRFRLISNLIYVQEERGLKRRLILAFDPIRGIGGHRLNGFLGLSLNDRTVLFLLIILDKTVSDG